MAETDTKRVTDEEALLLHATGRPGKLEITATKPLTTQRDLALAYSPGVAAPCLRIAEDPSLAYDYTAKGNIVAVISNGTAVLGLGDLGALASKPVMEGKAVLFKRFADVDGIDLEVDTKDVEEFINAVRFLGPSFGGINLEDIKAPDCFIIEERLRALMSIPVFHDDQHGTAIIAAAGLINACDITGRSLKTTRLVVNGAGAAGIACAQLFCDMGLPRENIILCDTKGVVYRGRTEGMNQWKSAFAAETDKRTLEEAVSGCDVFIGLSAKGAMTQAMVKTMADKPIIFALANPDPEITPEEAKAVRPDVIIATGRSDYPNQINNVLGFPYIFRGALDVRATTINEAMKVAAAKALAALAREDVPDEVDAAYAGRRLRYGPEYIIPVPFDPRLIVTVPCAVAQAAIESGVARKPIVDMAGYRTTLRNRLDPTADALELIFDKVRSNPRRVVFAEGEDERTIRAALAFRAAGYGTPVLIGREEVIKEHLASVGSHRVGDLEIHGHSSEANRRYTDFLYRRLQRKGVLYSDCQRLVDRDRNVFAALMVAQGGAHAMVTGLNHPFHACFEAVTRVFDPKPGERVFGLTVLVNRARTVFIADTTVNETPKAEMLADIAIQAAAKARQMGHEPRVALVSYSNFGQSRSDQDVKRVQDAVAILDQRRVDFEYDGEMSADVALDYALMKRVYPFCRLSEPANVLVMPTLHAANIAAKLMHKMTRSTVFGPLLIGMDKPVQIVSMGATPNDMVTMAVLAAHDSLPW